MPGHVGIHKSETISLILGYLETNEKHEFNFKETSALCFFIRRCGLLIHFSQSSTKQDNLGVSEGFVLWRFTSLLPYISIARYILPGGYITKKKTGIFFYAHGNQIKLLFILTAIAAVL